MLSLLEDQGRDTVQGAEVGESGTLCLLAPQRSHWLRQVPFPSESLPQAWKFLNPGILRASCHKPRAVLPTARSRTWFHRLSLLRAELPGTPCVLRAPLASLLRGFTPRSQKGAPPHLPAQPSLDSLECVERKC